MTITTFETGATTHAVNDLILFTDNTRELVEIRDSIYQLYVNKNLNEVKPVSFGALLIAAGRMYATEFPTSWGHIKNMSKEEHNEFLQLYCDDFNNWKLEHGITT